MWGLVGAVLALAGGYALFRPHVSIEPGIVLVPGDPYSTQFDTTNDSALFDIKNLKPSCYTVFVETDHDVQLASLPSLPLPTVPLLGPREKTTMSCRAWIGGLGAGTGNVTKAYIIVGVSYEQDWWPGVMSQTFPLRGVIDSQKGVHWTHITPSELQAMSRPSPVSK